MFFIVLEIETIRFSFKEFTGRCAPYFSIVTRWLSIPTTTLQAFLHFRFLELQFKFVISVYQFQLLVLQFTNLAVKRVHLRVALGKPLLQPVYLLAFGIELGHVGGCVSLSPFIAAIGPPFASCFTPSIPPKAVMSTTQSFNPMSLQDE